MPLNRLPILAALLAVATWALAGIWVRLLPDLPLAVIVAGRLALALPFVAPLAVQTARRAEAGRWGRGTWGLAALMGAYYVCTVAAFRFAPIAEATLLVNTSPLFAVALAPVAGHAVSRREVTGVVLALVGVSVVPVLADGGEAGRAVGDTLGLAAGALMAAYAVLYRRLADEAPAPAVATTATFGLGAVALAALLVVQPGTVASIARPNVALPLLGLDVASTAVPTYAFSAASRVLPPVTTTAVRLLSPAIAAVFAFGLLGEVPSLWLLPGGALVLAGLGLDERGRHRLAFVYRASTPARLTLSTDESFSTASTSTAFEEVAG